MMHRALLYSRVLCCVGLITWSNAWAKSPGANSASPSPKQTPPSTVTSPTIDWQGLPGGTGREDVFDTCQACHSLMLVKQQHLDREGWQGILTLMVEEKGLVVPTPEVMERIIDYLATHFGPTPGNRVGTGGMPPPLSGMRP